MVWYEDLYEDTYEDSWYEDGSFFIHQDQTVDGAQWFIVQFYGPEPAESYMQTAYLTKTDLLCMRRAIDKAIKAASIKDEQ